MEDRKSTISTSEIQRNLSKLAGKILATLFPVFLYAIIQLIRFGNKNDYLTLLLGSIFSVGGAMAYEIAILTYGVKKRKSYLAMLLTFFSFITYLFGCYLVFIRGFWSVRYIITNFSLWLIIEALISIFLGYFVVRNIYKISQIGEMIRKDTFNISDQ